MYCKTPKVRMFCKCKKKKKKIKKIYGLLIIFQLYLTDSVQRKDLVKRFKKICFNRITPFLLIKLFNNVGIEDINCCSFANGTFIQYRLI